MSGQRFLRQEFGALLMVFALLLPGNAFALSIERVVSAGGIEAWLARDASIPIVAVEMAFGASGSAMDPKGKEGLAYLLSGLLDEGAGELNSERFRQVLEDHAIELRFDTGRDDFVGSMKTLRENHVLAFDLLRQALTLPRFDADAVARIQNQVLSTLAQRADDPGAIAQRTWLRTAFPDHAYGKPRRGTQKSVQAINVEDLRGFASRHLARANLIIGVAGDISAEELGPLLDRTFGALPTAPKETTPLTEATVKNAGEVVAVEKPIPQSVVVFGQAGLKRDDPDYYAAYVMNHILGGAGLNSRLARQIRVDRGLAYSVYSTLVPLERGGLLMGEVATRNDQIGQVLELIRAEWKRMAETPVSETELDDAKTYLTGAFPLSLDSTDRIAGVLVTIQRHNLGIDYLDRRNGYIGAVTAEDVARVARRLLKSEALGVAIVGKPDGFATKPATD